MVTRKVIDKIQNGSISMRAKLLASILSVAVVLFVSCIISIMEYRRMSSYVSDMVARDISGINTARTLSDMSNTYNLAILAVIGEDISARLPDFDDTFFTEHCDSLRRALPSQEVSALSDSVMYSYSAYMLTSLELENVLVSDFIDSRSWYFERLQPRFERLRGDIDALSRSIHEDLEDHSVSFERGFYRSTIPSLVAVGVGLLLLLMLLFFILSGYVNPIYKMLASLKAYRTADKKYTFTFDGDDQLCELNEGIRELTGENQQLRSRISAIKNRQ